MKNQSFYPLLLSFQVLVNTVCIAQQEMGKGAAHFIDWQFGVNQIKDQNLHPKVSTGTITALSYGFEKRKSTLQQFEFSLAYSRVKTKYEDLAASANIRLNLSYSLNFSLIQKANFNYYLGPQAVVAYNACFFPNWDDSHLYWADFISVGAKNNIAVQLNNGNEWMTSLAFPLFSVFSRPDPYRLFKIDDTDFGGIVRNLNSNLTAAHLVNVFYLNLHTEYRFPVFKNKQEAFFYALEWQRVKADEGNAFQQFTHQIGLKLFL